MRTVHESGSLAHAALDATSAGLRPLAGGACRRCHPSAASLMLACGSTHHNRRVQSCWHPLYTLLAMPPHTLLHSRSPLPRSAALEGAGQARRQAEMLSSTAVSWLSGWAAGVPHTHQLQHGVHWQAGRCGNRRSSNSRGQKEQQQQGSAAVVAAVRQRALRVQRARAGGHQAGGRGGCLQQRSTRRATTARSGAGGGGGDASGTGSSSSAWCVLCPVACCAHQRPRPGGGCCPGTWWYAGEPCGVPSWGPASPHPLTQPACLSSLLSPLCSSPWPRRVWTKLDYKGR